MKGRIWNRRGSQENWNRSRFISVFVKLSFQMHNSEIIAQPGNKSGQGTRFTIESIGANVTHLTDPYVPYLINGYG